MKLSRIPTGIDSLDPILGGGLPSGSLILLFGEIGAGDSEFALTSAMRMLINGAEKRSGVIIPDKVSFVSFTRSKEDVMNEIASSFPGYYNILQSNLSNRFKFKDFSDAYFARSFIPAAWRSSFKPEVSFESLKWSVEQTNLLETLIEYLDKNANGSLVIIDSLTALIQYCLEHMEWRDLILFLRGLQKASKKWDGLVYLLLGKGIFESTKEEEVMDVADGVLVFEWVQEGFSRQQAMYMKKFRALMPHIAKDNIVRFDTAVTDSDGFMVINVKRISGRR